MVAAGQRRVARWVRSAGACALMTLAPLAAATTSADAQSDGDRSYGAQFYGDGSYRDEPYRYERDAPPGWDDRAPVDDRADSYDRYDERLDGRYAARNGRSLARDEIYDADGDAFGALDAYGVWLDHAEWGTVWRPNVARDWRPYTIGRWVNTEEYGWYWESDEPFGWAVFHYGRWVWDARAGGWLWLPGTEWAPAWVAWSHSDEWVGWAPLPPDAIWHDDAGLTVRAHFYEPRYAPWWVFVSPRHLLYPGVHRHLAPHRRSIEVLRLVRPSTDYRWRGRSIYNAGVNVRQIERLTRTRIAPTRIVVARSPRFDRNRSGAVSVFRPRIAPSARWQAGRSGSWRQFDGPRARTTALPTRTTPFDRTRRDVRPEARPEARREARPEARFDRPQEWRGRLRERSTPSDAARDLDRPRPPQPGLAAPSVQAPQRRAFTPPPASRETGVAPSEPPRRTWQPRARERRPDADVPAPAARAMPLPTRQRFEARPGQDAAAEGRRRFRPEQRDVPRAAPPATPRAAPPTAQAAAQARSRPQPPAATPQPDQRPNRAERRAQRAAGAAPAETEQGRRGRRSE